ncbi:hypothetical protein B0T20DRAFT_359042 [Sordaria brevicollis]|uniref:Uncharacterized protein n=1 Tax=Sordaria brevicollis TaxID=83679 RepID=A0AAE0U959_SORBR|nr:hypothetical protein B0T20DRAFT_359042 [Sordaria brevicollis]
MLGNTGAGSQPQRQVDRPKRAALIGTARAERNRPCSVTVAVAGSCSTGGFGGLPVACCCADADVSRSDVSRGTKGPGGCGCLTV